jgi:pimeloyl-ACP methyl ester carboxylesterase
MRRLEGNCSVQETPGPVEGAFVDVRGSRVHYLHAGTGRPLLLIHGIAGSSNNWRRILDALAKGAEIYAIDQLNTGKSQQIDGLDAALEAAADRIAATMDALGVSRADIAGHSHGGAVALMLAARHPERVHTLILFAPVNPFSQVGDLLVRAYNTPPGRLLARTAPNLPRQFQRYVLGRMYGDPARIADGCLQTYIDGLRTPGTLPHILAILGAWFRDMATLEAALPLVADTPTMLVWGDRDRAVDPASAVQLQAILRRSELHIVPGCGHIVFEELPEEASRLMLEWLRRTPA